jgi:hypothetical protein
MNARGDVLTVDGTRLTVRPITLPDVDRLDRLFTRLSPETVHSRFFSPVRRPRAALLRLADVDHRRRDALRRPARARPGGRDRRHRRGRVAARGLGAALAARLTRLARDRGYEVSVSDRGR